MKDRMDEIRSTRAPKLREDQLEILRRYGQTRKAEPGEVLFRAGDASNDFIVVLEGEVEAIDDLAGEARTLLDLTVEAHPDGRLEAAWALNTSVSNVKPRSPAPCGLCP